MESRKYSARELLRLRHAPANKPLLKKLKATVKQDDELRKYCSSLKIFFLILTLAVDNVVRTHYYDDGPASNEIDDARYATRPLTRQYDGTNSDYPRSRAVSEYAPSVATGTMEVPVKKSEGFQQFIEQVVSPDHVRVTAGGRIVPNTRGAHSPAHKWVRERAQPDGVSGNRAVSGPAYRPEGIPYPQHTYAPVMVVPPGGGPPMITYRPVPYPIVPIPMGMNMAGGYAMPPVAGQSGVFQPGVHQPDIHQPGIHQPVAHQPVVHQPSVHQPDIHQPDIHQSGVHQPGAHQPVVYHPVAPQPFQPDNQAYPADGQYSGNSSGQNGAVQYSDPDQFDRNRPFWYNGQWSMVRGDQCIPCPDPPGQESLAVVASQTPQVNGIDDRSSTEVTETTQPSRPTNIRRRSGKGRPRAPATEPARPSRTPQAVQDEKITRSRAPSAPEISTNDPESEVVRSSIRGSLVARRQLQCLRGGKQWHIDQLRYNSHQVDQYHMTLAIKSFDYQIGHFEEKAAALEAAEALQEAKDAELRAKKRLARSTQSGDDKPVDMNKQVASHGPSTSSIKNQSGNGDTKARGHVAAKSTKTYRSTDTSSDDKKTKVKMSSLPRHAALAPPFQPRALREESPVTPDEPAPVQDSPKKESTGSKRVVSNWSSFFKKPQAAKDYGTPYMVGNLPAGIDPDTARDTEYIYPRNLTAEEDRARYNYWTQTTERGLPKYDGKHFYPASPVKEDSAETLQKPPRMASNDPYQALAYSGIATVRGRPNQVTQSESLPREGTSLRGSSLDTPISLTPLAQPSPKYLEFRRLVDEKVRAVTAENNGRASADSSDEALLFRGRRSLGRSARYVDSQLFSSFLFTA